MEGVSGIAVALGRALLGGLFVVGGIRHFFILGVLTPIVARRGVPFPRQALILASAFEVAAGGLLMLGVLVAPAALGLILFTLVASCVMLNFWSLEGPEREMASNVWLSNIAIIGGLLIAFARGGS